MNSGQILQDSEIEEGINKKEFLNVNPQILMKAIGGLFHGLLIENKDDLDNRLLLCNYHHHGMGDKYRQEILFALENGSAEYNPFNNSNDKGYKVKTKILGHQSIGPLKREKENDSLLRILHTI